MSDTIRVEGKAFGTGNQAAATAPSRDIYKEVWMFNTLSLSPVITAKLVPDDRRVVVVRRYVGQNKAALENLIMVAMRDVCSDYQGGYWYFYELNNNAFYMAPGRDEKLSIAVPHNYFQGTMSADAAGLVASLRGINCMAQLNNAPKYTRFYNLLMDYALGHTEAAKIMKAVDFS